MLRPLANNLLIEGIEKQSVAGIIIPDTARKGRPETGKVVAVGPKVLNVKVGDKVLIKGYMIDELTIDDKKYLVGQEDAVIGIINDDNK